MQSSPQNSSFLPHPLSSSQTRLTHSFTRLRTSHSLIFFTHQSTPPKCSSSPSPLSSSPPPSLLPPWIATATASLVAWPLPSVPLACSTQAPNAAILMSWASLTLTVSLLLADPATARLLAASAPQSVKSPSAVSSQLLAKPFSALTPSATPIKRTAGYDQDPIEYSHVGVS